MPTIDEQRALQKENAEAEERFWSTVRDIEVGAITDHKSLAAKAADTIADGETRAARAEANAKAAKVRADAIDRGENVAGGLCQPMTSENIKRNLIESGWTARDFRRMQRLAEMPGFGTEHWEAMKRDMVKRLDRATDAAINAAWRKWRSDSEQP